MTNIDTMLAGAEMDAAVARAMGWTEVCVSDGIVTGCEPMTRAETYVPRFSTDPAAMIVAIEWLRNELGYFDIQAGPGVNYKIHKGIGIGTADKLPVAIARAIIKYAAEKKSRTGEAK